MLIAAYVVPHPPIILPEIGQGEEKKIAKTSESYHAIAQEIAKLQPETIIILSPHAPSYLDYIHIANGAGASGHFGRFHHPEITCSVDYDEQLIRTICSYTKRNRIAAGVRGEQLPTLDHGTMIPLYFIQQYYQDFQVVRISVSKLSADEHERFGQCIAAAVEDEQRRTVLLASGDLSHRLKPESSYGFAQEGVQFDELAVHALQTNDLQQFLHMDAGLCEKAAQCGLPTFQMLCGALREYDFISTFYSYEGPFGVGYCICSFHEHEEDPYIRLARTALSQYLSDKTYLTLPQDLPQEMKQRSGVFVSIHKNNALRGCIGTISPMRKNIAEEIIMNAISAGTRDPRFPPMSLAELRQVRIHVDVLSRLEPVFFPDELDVKRYGLVVTSGHKRGLLLPNIDGVDTVEQQLAIALRKADIDPNDYYTMERFEVTRHQ